MGWNHHLGLLCGIDVRTTGWICNLSLCLVFVLNTDHLTIAMMGFRESIRGSFTLDTSRYIYIYLYKDEDHLNIYNCMSYLNMFLFGSVLDLYVQNWSTIVCWVILIHNWTLPAYLWFYFTLIHWERHLVRYLDLLKVFIPLCLSCPVQICFPPPSAPPKRRVERCSVLFTVLSCLRMYIYIYIIPKSPAMT